MTGWIEHMIKFMELPEYTKGDTWPEPELYMDRFHWRPSDPTEKCVRVIGPEGGPIGEGRVYEEFLCLYPWLKPFYMNWEINWRPYDLGYQLLNFWWLPFVCIVIYLVLIFQGQKYFSTRPPWNFRRTLMAWNLLLTVFSIIGFFRVLPIIVHITWNYKWYENFCFDPWAHSGHNEGGIWIFFFCWSKIFELFDTFFIVVHKKPLIVLHWYHHVSVLLCSVFYGLYTAPIGIYFCLINYGVHSIMYFYYFLMAARVKPKWMNPKFITLLQILQMAFGSVASITGLYLNYTGYPYCYTRPINALPFFVLYFSYLYLFSKFFFDRYYGRKDSKMKIF